MRPMMVDRARDLFKEKTDRTAEEVSRILQGEYPEFPHDECSEAATLVLKVLLLVDSGFSDEAIAPKDRRKPSFALYMASRRPSFALYMATERGGPMPKWTPEELEEMIAEAGKQLALAKEHKQRLIDSKPDTQEIEKYRTEMAQADRTIRYLTRVATREIPPDAPDLKEP